MLYKGSKFTKQLKGGTYISLQCYNCLLNLPIMKFKIVICVNVIVSIFKLLFLFFLTAKLQLFHGNTKGKTCEDRLLGSTSKFSWLTNESPSICNMYCLGTQFITVIFNIIPNWGSHLIFCLLCHKYTLLIKEGWLLNGRSLRLCLPLRFLSIYCFLAALKKKKFVLENSPTIIK